MQHGVLQWRPKDRSRRFLILRYEPTFQSNWSDAGNIPPSGKLNQRLIRSRKASSRRWKRSKALKLTEALKLCVWTHQSWLGWPPRRKS